MVGALAAMATKSKYEAITLLADVTLIEIESQKILLKETIEGKLEGEDVADPTGVSVFEKANLSLKAAASQLVLLISQTGATENGKEE